MAVNRAQEEVRISIPGQVLGLADAEKEYTLSSWRALDVPWREAAEAGFCELRDGIVRCLWVYSASPGTAKTGFAASLSREFAERGAYIAIVRCAAVNDMVPDARREVMAEVRRAGIVVLDDVDRLDLDRRYLADWFHALADHAYLKRKRVVVTANRSLAELACESPDRCRAAFDRFREGGMRTIEASGGSVRA